MDGKDSVMLESCTGGSPDDQAKLDVFTFNNEHLGYTDKLKHETNQVDDIPVTKPIDRNRKYHKHCIK